MTDRRIIWCMNKRIRNNSQEKVMHTGISHNTDLIDILRLFSRFFTKCTDKFFQKHSDTRRKFLCTMLQRIIGTHDNIRTIFCLYVQSTCCCQLFSCSSIQKIPGYGCCSNIKRSHQYRFIVLFFQLQNFITAYDCSGCSSFFLHKMADYRKYFQLRPEHPVCLAAFFPEFLIYRFAKSFPI